MAKKKKKLKKKIKSKSEQIREHIAKETGASKEWVDKHLIITGFDD